MRGDCFILLTLFSFGRLIFPGRTCLAHQVSNADSPNEAILVNNGHSKCVHCLGESHISQKCNFCLIFKCRPRKNRETKLRLFMTEHSLPPEPGQEKPPTSRMPVLRQTQSMPGQASPKEWKIFGGFWGGSQKEKCRLSIQGASARKDQVSPPSLRSPRVLLRPKTLLWGLVGL